ncbi:MAG TPA: pitrilysin family protein [Gemmatimonadaceae bacterium]
MTSLARRAGLAAMALGLFAVAHPALAQRPRAKAPPSRNAAGAPALPEAAARQRTVLEKVIHREVLPNGMEVIVVENHGVPLATVEIDVKNGAFTQTHEYEGLAHMYEHMFFKSNVDYPEPEEFVQRAAELGAVFNGSTREEVVNYYITVPTDSLEGGMQFLASAFRAPLFRPDELERERAVVIGEYDRQESSPFFKFTDEMNHRLWRSAYSRKNMIGARDIILSTTPDKMREIQHRYYVPNNAALIIAGDVQPAQAFALARRLFGAIPRGEDPFVQHPIPPVPPLAHDDAVIVEEPVSTVFVMEQWLGPSVGEDPEATYAADVFSDVMNQEGSAFQRRLVDSGLWHSVVVNYYTLNHTGPITISGETTPDKLREALAALDSEIARFDDPGYFTAAELQLQKRQRVVGTALGLERASGFAHELGFWWSVAGLDYYLGYVDNMAHQTPDDLRRYVRKYILGKPRVVGVLIDPEARRQLALTTGDLLQRKPATAAGGK